MKTAWRRWRELAISERFTLLQALLLLPLVGLLLRLFRYQAVLSFLERATPLKIRGSQQGVEQEAKRTGELVNIAAWRRVYAATCLRRSLVLWWILRRRRIDSRIRIGVRTENGEFSSHAWVEWQDVVVNDAADVQDRFLSIM